MSLATQWSVSVAGIDCSDAMNPYILSIETVDKAGGSSDTATLEFDDAEGQCKLPRKGDPVTITLEGVEVFVGVVDDAESSGSRGGGMTLSVACTSVDKRGKVKERQNLHKDNSTLEEFLKAAAKKAGITSVKVDKAFASIKREWWSTEGRSFLQLGRELAEEFGATFKIRGKAATFAKRGEGGSPGGGSLPSVSVVYGDNLISWRIRPYESRPRYAKARLRWYDRKKAKWKQEDVEVGNQPGSDALDIGGQARADQGAAKDAGKGRKTESEREGGAGDVTILLAVEARAEGTCIVSGVRPGVDGSYRIETATHRVSRGGSETRLSLKQPQGEAGTDSRGSSPK
jgi:phage protein D